MEFLMITPRHRWTLAAPLAIAIAVGTGTFAYLNWNRTVIVAGLFINYFRTFAAPDGTLITENAPTDETAVDAGAPESFVRDSEKKGDWPSYNKSLTSERYSRLSEINTGNIQKI